MAFKFTSADCSTAANELNSSATNIGQYIERLGELIASVQGNYQSDASEQIASAFNKVKSVGPAFQDAISQCSKYLTDTVAPAYEKLESSAKSKVEGINI